MRPSVLRLTVLSFGLVLSAFGQLGCQQLANDLGSGGSDASVSGSVCVGGTDSSGADGLVCCQANGADCDGDYACCRGLCSGGLCASSDNESCTTALGSRCAPAADCGCDTDDDSPPGADGSRVRAQRLFRALEALLPRQGDSVRGRRRLLQRHVRPHGVDLRLSSDHEPRGSRGR